MPASCNSAGGSQGLLFCSCWVSAPSTELLPAVWLYFETGTLYTCLELPSKGLRTWLCEKKKNKKNSHHTCKGPGLHSSTLKTNKQTHKQINAFLFLSSCGVRGSPRASLAYTPGLHLEYHSITPSFHPLACRVLLLQRQQAMSPVFHPPASLRGPG